MLTIIFNYTQHTGFLFIVMFMIRVRHEPHPVPPLCRFQIQMHIYQNRLLNQEKKNLMMMKVLMMMRRMILVKKMPN